SSTSFFYKRSTVWLCVYSAQEIAKAKNSSIMQCLNGFPNAPQVPRAQRAVPAAAVLRPRPSRHICRSDTKSSVENLTIQPAPFGNPEDVLEVPTLRNKLTPRRSPFYEHDNFGGGFVSDHDRVALNSMRFAGPNSAGASQRVAPGYSRNGQPATGVVQEGALDQLQTTLPPWGVRAGARETIYFDPQQVTAAIVTCGGLCPGLNDVTAGIVNKLADYGVPEGRILGIKYGFRCE
ncbi:hypothetical protein DUNSADRAFT_4488, partial [Dunaliella salina]